MDRILKFSDNLRKILQKVPTWEIIGLNFPNELFLEIKTVMINK